MNFFEIKRMIILFHKENLRKGTQRKKVHELT